MSFINIINFIQTLLWYERNKTLQDMRLLENNQLQGDNYIIQRWCRLFSSNSIPCHVLLLTHHFYEID